MAGGLSLRSVASATGLSYQHLVAVENGREPLLAGDAIALSELLGVPGDWLRRGWRSA